MIGLCSWSLRPAGPAALASAATELGVTALQLSLKPLRLRRWGRGWSLSATRRELGAAGLKLRSGMIGLPGERAESPEAFARSAGLRAPAPWPVLRRHLRRFARLASELELPLLSWHAGRMGDEAWFLDQLGETARFFARQGVALALETGQESAERLHAGLRALAEPSLGVNFDPANFVLHASDDPCAALELLAPRVRQLHVKDALPPERAGEWGREVPFGDGVVDWPGIFERLRARGLVVDLMIEREAGDQREQDIRRALQGLEQH